MPHIILNFEDAYPDKPFFFKSLFGYAYPKNFFVFYNLVLGVSGQVDLVFMLQQCNKYVNTNNVHIEKNNWKIEK